MTAFVTRNSTHLGADRVATTVTATALYENLKAVLEKDSSAVSAGWILANGYVVEAMLGALAVTEGKLGALAATEGKIGAAAISQSKVKSTTGTFSGSGSWTLPGGEYGFTPQYKRGSGAGSVAAALGTSVLTSYATFLSLTPDAGVAEGQQRYISASPPYDHGDGEVPLYVFAVIDNGTGTVLAVSSTEDPPWANNGPTNIRVDFFDQQGRGFQRRQRRLNLAALRNPATRDAELERIRLPETVEVTQAVKHADMPLIPHPFQANDLTGKTVVLLDPVSQLVERLRRIQRSGESMADILHGEYLTIGNSPLARRGPPGVMPVEVTWR